MAKKKKPLSLYRSTLSYIARCVRDVHEHSTAAECETCRTKCNALLTLLPAALLDALLQECENSEAFRYSNCYYHLFLSNGCKVFDVDSYCSAAYNLPESDEALYGDGASVRDDQVLEAVSNAYALLFDRKPILNRLILSDRYASSQLPKLLSCQPNLKIITIENLESDTRKLRQIMKDIGAVAHNLEELQVYSSKNTDDIIESIIPDKSQNRVGCPQVKRLHLKCNVKLESLDKVLLYLPRLELVDSQQLSDLLLTNEAQNSSTCKKPNYAKLTYLQLTNINKSIYDSDMIKYQSSSVTTLDVIALTTSQAHLLRTFLPRWHNLSHLHLCALEMTYDTIQPFIEQHGNQLQVLNLEARRHVDNLEAYVKHCRNLRNLIINQTSPYWDQVNASTHETYGTDRCTELYPLPQLEKLRMSHCTRQDENSAYIKSLMASPRLQHLVLQNVNCVTDHVLHAVLEYKNPSQELPNKSEAEELPNSTRRSTFGELRVLDVYGCEYVSCSGILPFVTTEEIPVEKIYINTAVIRVTDILPVANLIDEENLHCEIFDGKLS